VFDPEEKNRSLADQWADAMSFDPVRRSATGDTMADALSQGLVNSLAGNRPGADRFRYGSGSFAKKLTQDWMDDAFATREDGGE
jgi:hypothetical protein